LSSEFIIQMLEIFTMTTNDSLRVGYDSLGGGCFINHLHVELLFLDDFDIEHLPIEKSCTEKILSTKFQPKAQDKNDDEINMIDDKYEVTMYKTDYFINSWKVEVKEVKHECNLLENNFYPSIATMVNFILTKLIDLSIPHNILISDKGQSFYIFPRKFIEASEKLEYNTCWNDLSGLITFKQGLPDDFDIESAKKQIALENDQFDQLTETLKNSFDELYLTI
jgi:hypothetical protein